MPSDGEGGPGQPLTPPLASDPGTYVLLLEVVEVRRLSIGRLGSLDAVPGFFAYVGSALGPGGVGARVERHFRRRGPIHWHVDYLRPVTLPREVWLAHHPERLEHAWADALAAMDGASVPLAGFGASDCRCASHLAHFPFRPRLEEFRRRAAAREPVEVRSWP